MKKIILLLIGTFLMVSCGKNKEEQMLYDYQQKNVKSLNFDLDDLDFKIYKVEKVADITASDSLKILKEELAGYLVENPKQSLIDTLSFKYVKDALNEAMTDYESITNNYQEAVISASIRGDLSSKYKYEEERNKAIRDKVDVLSKIYRVEWLENYYNLLAVKPDSILSSKFTAKYSQNNPLLGNTKQTFEKTFYTNSEQTEFVKSESDEKE
jgi:hypothetical protein